MKIAIDARKWRDFGIGTYVRNLVRHLASLDRQTTFFLFCNPADEATLRDLAANFVPVVDDSAGYGFREHFSIPWKLRRLGADLLHTPHYVRPLLCTTPTVVTIHDCIHLLFPEYLPSRMAWRYAHAMMGSAIRRSALVFTVSEASRRDILHFYPWADPDRVQVVPNALDDALLADPGPEEMERVKERYQIRGRFVLYAGNIKPHKNLERLIRAYRAGQGEARLRGLEAHHHRRRGHPLSRPAALRGIGRGAPGRPLLRLRARSDPGRALSHGLGVRVPLALRGLRPAAARGHGLRHSRRDLAHLVPARGVRRRRRARGSAQRGRHRRRYRSGCWATRGSGPSSWSGGTRGCKLFSWERSVEAIHAGYMKVLGQTVTAVATEPAR